jgi:hypothetical protein
MRTFLSAGGGGSLSPGALGAFNAAIVGPIEVIATFHSEDTEQPSATPT